MRFDPQSLTEIADEYVLGLLDPADAAEVEAALASDTALARAVAAAQDRFLPLDATAEPVEVSPQLWTEIEAGLATALVQAPAAAASGEPRLPSATNDNARSPWRITAISSMAASLVLAVGLAWSVTRTVEPVVVAVLVDDAGEIRAVVEDFGNDTASVKLLADLVIPQGKTMQVWTLPSRDMGPKSLGLLEDGQSATLAGWSLPAPSEAQLYEITLEQAGGSPTGLPTGPILAKGFAKRTR